MKINKALSILASLLLVSALTLAGCAQAPTPSVQPLVNSGALTLSVNPEIEIAYNQDGQVTALTGRNDDGREIVASYPDYIGKDCASVLEDLIGKIHQAGYFVEEAEGDRKTVVLQLEPGSVLPQADFLERLCEHMQQKVQGLELSAPVVSIDDDDYDVQYARDGQPSPYITLEKAQQIALAHTGMESGQAAFAERDFDLDDGVAVYELEFSAGGLQYEVDVDARTGKVLRQELETPDIDDRNDDDDRDDDNDDDRQPQQSAAPAGVTRPSAVPSTRPQTDDDRDDDWDDQDDDRDDQDDDRDDQDDDRDDDWDDQDDDRDDWDDQDDDRDDQDDDRDDDRDDWDDQDDDRDDQDDDRDHD